MTTQEFYANAVFVDPIDYTLIEDVDDRPQQPLADVVRSTVLRTIASCAIGTVVMFGPVSATLLGADVEVRQVIVHVKTPPEAALPAVAVPDAQRAAAERFRRMFRVVPLSEVERIADPDFV